MKKLLIPLFLSLALLATLRADPVVSDVHCQQRYPWNGLVDIDFTLSGIPARKAANLVMTLRTPGGAAGEGVRMVSFAEGSALEGLTNGTHRVTWNAASDIGNTGLVYSNRIVDVSAALTEAFATGPHQGVRLWENGPLWATVNLGADSPEGAGYFFWWGDTVGYRRVDGKWSAVDGSNGNFSFSSANAPTYGKDAVWLQWTGYAGANGNLVEACDAAAAHWGDGWRMPTEDEFANLTSDLCKRTWTSYNGVRGWLVSGVGAYALNSVFFPAAGYGDGTGHSSSNSTGFCWSSSLPSSDGTLEISSSYFRQTSRAGYYGCPVRPVYGFTVNVLSGTGSGTYRPGDVVTVTATVPSGFVFNGWAGDGAAYLSAADTATATLLMPYGNVSLRALCGPPAESGVQLWEGGPYWATCNVGATAPEQDGDYFWWGDNVGYRLQNGTWMAADGSGVCTFSYSSCPTYDKSAAQLQSEGYTDGTGNLAPAHDAAACRWGGGWRMPTDAEFEALKSNCTTTWTTQGGVRGRLVTGKGAYASKSIFLPVAGQVHDSSWGSSGWSYYWSSTPNSGYSDTAWYLYFNSGNIDRNDDLYRYYGRSVRPVRGFAQ